MGHNHHTAMVSCSEQLPPHVTKIDDALWSHATEPVDQEGTTGGRQQQTGRQNQDQATGLLDRVHCPLRIGGGYLAAHQCPSSALGPRLVAQ